jgi:hypothetical protein
MRLNFRDNVCARDKSLLQRTARELARNLHVRRGYEDYEEVVTVLHAGKLDTN